MFEDARDNGHAVAICLALVFTGLIAAWTAELLGRTIARITQRKP